MLEESGIAYKSYLKGSYFGDIEVMQRLSRLDTVQTAASAVELYILAHEHFFALMEKFPDVADELVAVSRVR